MILHVACLPFPSYQGTQAAIDAMLRAWCNAGHVSHLLTYAHGSHELDAPYTVHRMPDFPKLRSLRSGPSVGKLALDLRGVFEIRALGARLRPAAVVAHHVEAAVIALAAGIGPAFYVAHTSLGDELPMYFPRVPEHAVRGPAKLLQQWIHARARGVAAVSPSLAELLGGVEYLPVPWSPSREAATITKHEARAELGLPPDTLVCLYAGNLDRYQGWEHLVDALVRLRTLVPTARLLVATQSDPRPLRRRAAKAGISNGIDLRKLDSERARAVAHAASDVAWVPRRSEGGLPIKMLDAFARGLPVVAMERATAGLPIHDACRVVANEDPWALASAARDLFQHPLAANALRDRAHVYLRTHHDESTYASAMRSWVGSPRATPPTTMRSGPHRRAEPARRAR